MKFWALGPLFVCLFSLPALAVGVNKKEPQILLSYQQFSRLTTAEQKTYIKKLREIMEEMSKAFPEFAEQLSARSSFFAQFWNLNFQTAFGEDDKKPTPKEVANFSQHALEEANYYTQDVAAAKTKNLTDDDKALLIAKYRQALYWETVAESVAHNKMKDSPEKNELLKEINKTRTQILIVEKQVKPFGVEHYAEAMKYYFEKAPTGEIDPDKYGFPEEALKNFESNLKLADLIKPKPSTLLRVKKESELNQTSSANYTKKNIPQMPLVSLGKDNKPTDKTERLQDSAKSTSKNSPAVIKSSSENGHDTPLGKYSIPEKDRAPIEIPRVNLDIYHDNKPPDLHKSNKPSDKAPVAENTTGTAKSKTIADSYYRCMYSGFVIKNGPDCMAPTSLPWKLAGIDSDKFVCDNGTVMCNPLIFGFKTSCKWEDANEKKQYNACTDSAAPYCVKPGLYATKNCGEMSNNESALQAAVLLINTNTETFNQFGTSF
ncbi:MAG: hypothetical protein ACXVBQ_17005, partial [Pseudobdellovibrionaceae bacterium]